MKFPKMRPQGARRLSVPDLAGGLNLRDGVSEILDNQLTQAKNVWWQNGVLKTRPGISTSNKTLQEVVSGHFDNVTYRDFKDVTRIIDEKSYYLRVKSKFSPFEEHLEEEPTETHVQYLDFYWCSNDTKPILVAPTISFPCSSESDYFVVQKGVNLYCFLSNGKVYEMDYIKNVESGFDEAECHVPTVLIDCKPNGSLSVKPEEVTASGVMFEGFNILSDFYKISYTAFNQEIADGGEHAMVYGLLQDCYREENYGKIIKAELTSSDGKTEIHKITIRKAEKTEWIIEEEKRPDGLQMGVRGNDLWFFSSVDSGGNKTTAQITKNSLRNNLVIEAPYIMPDEERVKVCRATKYEWFGGGAEGIAGGTRLFLGGNTSEGNKNLVVWSDLNNPLYFPENNYFRVGENSSAVTGFGKQADMLVIFKANGSGIYYTKYQQNTDISAEDLINQNVIDYTASSVYFPLVQINPNVGCSHPDTIQLCRNRLVWLGDNGNVYTLVNESQYNERSVFCVSEMVARDLKRNIKANATACDWEGYYCLMYGNKLYLMDYNCYGYTHVASYSKTEDANVRIPWYIWELPIEGNMFNFDDEILINFFLSAEIGSQRAILSYVLSKSNGSKDVVLCENEDESLLSLESKAIETVLRTKLFDFGEPNTRKSVDKINLQLGNNGGKPIAVKIITDQSEEEHDIYLSGEQTEAYTPGYIDSKAIFPCARNVLRIGVELSSNGVVAVDGMEIKYRSLGGAR